MVERLIQEGMRSRSLRVTAGEGRCEWERAMRYRPVTCFFMAIISLSSSMHSSRVISMPQLALIAGSFAHVTLSPCTQYACQPIYLCTGRERQACKRHIHPTEGAGKQHDFHSAPASDSLAEWKRILAKAAIPAFMCASNNGKT